MSDGGGVLAMTAAGVGINAAYAVAHGHEPFGIVLAGGALLGVFMAVESFSPGLATAGAGLFLLGTVLIHGEWFVTLIERVTNTKG